MSPSGKPYAIREQYHHYIPRFILRYFQVDSGVRKTKKERQKEYWKAKKKPVLQSDKILFYDLTTRILDTRPIGSVYGVTDLYKDIKNIENIYHVEKMFSRLENDAAALVKKLHEDISNGKEIIVTRKELGIFRKFLFLMHTRNSSRSLTYFQEDHPENAPLRDWIRKKKQDKGLKNDIEVWLDSMQYQLEHPHHLLVAEGEAIIEGLGGRLKAEMMLRTRVDPNINQYALEYTNVANSSFTGIWEAASGAEFVIGSSSFGLWEGFLFGQSGLHRLYVLSPRVAVILRDAQAASSFGRNFIVSSLIDIPMEFPKTRYTSFKPEDFPSENVERKLAEYRVSDAAQKDTYTFKVTKLTKEQTQAVNEVLLLNIRDDQSVTFASKSCMIDTLQAYYRSDDRFVKQSRRKYNALLRVLPSHSVQDDGAGFQTTSATSLPKASPLSTGDFSIDSPCVLSAAIDSPHDGPESSTDRNLRLVLQAIVNGTLEFPSWYDRAYRVYHTATDNLSSQSYAIRRITSDLVSQASFPPMSPSFCPRPHVRIVERLPQAKADTILPVLQRHLQTLLHTRPSEERGKSLSVEMLINEASQIGWLEWLAKNRHDVLESLELGFLMV